MKLLEKKDAAAMGSPFLGSPLGFLLGPNESLQNQTLVVELIRNMNLSSFA